MSVAGSDIDPGRIINALPHPVLVVDRGGQIECANAAAEVFFSAGAALLHKAPLNEFFAVDSPLLGLVERVSRKGISVNEYAVRLGLLPGQAARLVDVHVAPMPERPGSVIIMLMHRQMADAIDRQLTHRHAARSVTGMAAHMAHEIKNPLSGIRGAAQLLEMVVGPDDKALTRLIREETDRITRLIDEMESFSDERPISREPVNLHEVLDHVHALARNGFASAITMEREYDPSLPPVFGNRDQLVQVFLNLVKNAAESVGNAKGQGGIRLTSAFRPGMRLSVPGAGQQVNLPLEFCVIDNGPGIPADIQSEIFEPFVTTKASGTGLGLALVAKIIDLHGGIVECRSRRGETVFRVLLPVYEKRS